MTKLSRQTYDWAYERMQPKPRPPYTMTGALLNNSDIRDKYALALRNKFDTLQEKTKTHTPNEKYNFVNAHIEAAAAEFIRTKQRTKSRIPWETLAVREKRADDKTASKWNGKNPTNTNALKLKKAQNELAYKHL